VVATLARPARFMPAAGRAFLVSDGPTIHDIDGDRLLYDADKIRGLERPFDAFEGGEVAAIAGRWPGHTWLMLTQREVSGDTHLFRWGDKRWTESHKVAGLVEDASSWGDGRLLLVVRRGSLAQGGTELAVAPAEGAPALPALENAAGACRLRPRRVRAFSSGEVIVDGDPCEAREGGGVVGRFAAGKTEGNVQTWPEPEGSTFGVRVLAARSASDVYAAGWRGHDADHPLGPYLARFDGKGTKLVDPPGEKPLAALTSTPRGVLWAIGSDAEGASELWQRSASGSWQRVALPEHDGAALAPRQVWARGDDDVWVVATAGQRAVVLHSKAAAEVVKLPRTTASEYRTLAAPQAGCRVFLALLGKPANASDYPELRAALTKANTKVVLLEFHRRGALTLGVVAYSAPMAKMLVDLVKKALPTTNSKIVCHEPSNKVRTFVYDPLKKTWSVQGS
jgi:hypothetical protein